MSILGRIERRLSGMARRVPGYRWFMIYKSAFSRDDQTSQTTSPTTEQQPSAEDAAHRHADERSIRRTAEAELGGTSSEDARVAYLRGANPGGLHHGGKGPDLPHHGHPDEDEE